MSKSLAAMSGGAICFLLLFICAFLAITVLGLIQAFSASIILGIVALVIEPCPFVFGVVYLFGVDVAAEIVKAFPQIFVV